MPGVRKLYTDSSGNLHVLKDTTSVIPTSMIGAGATQVEYDGAIASVAVGLSGTYGAASNLTPDTGFSQIDPKTIQFVLGGSFAMSENVTVKVVATYNDASTVTYTPAAFTSTGTTNKVTSDFSTLIVDNKTITKLAFSAKTDQASTSVTVEINVFGTENV